MRMRQRKKKKARGVFDEVTRTVVHSKQAHNFSLRVHIKGNSCRKPVVSANKCFSEVKTNVDTIHDHLLVCVWDNKERTTPGFQLTDKKRFDKPTKTTVQTTKPPTGHVQLQHIAIKYVVLYQ